MRSLAPITVWLAIVWAGASAAGLDTRPAPLDEAAQDRARAAARFALAHTLYEQGDLAGALQSYQRAWRWDPSQSEPLDQIVPLAASLGQEDVAIRYALIQADQGAATVEMLRRLALHATQQQLWPQAARLYHEWLQRSPPAEDPFARALVQIERGRLELLTGDFAAASRAFAEPQHAMLDHPESDLARRVQASLGGALSSTLETFASCHLDAGELQLAAQALAALASAADPSPRTPYWLARLSLEQRQPLEAQSLLWTYFEGPDDSLGALPCELLRRTLVLLNDADRVPAELQRLQELRPASPYPTATLARRSVRLDLINQAREHYQRLVDAAADDSPMQLTEELFAEAGGWLLRDAISNQRPNRVLPLLTQLCETDPLLSLFTAELEGLANDAEMNEQVHKRLLVAMGAMKQDEAVLLAGRRVALQLGDYKLASAFLKRTIEYKKPSNARELALQTAVDFLVADQPEFANDTLDWARKADAVDPDDADAWFYQSTALAMADQPDEALAAARKAAELQPESAQFASQAAWVLRECGRTEQAVSEYEQLIEQFQDDHDPATREALRDARLTLSYTVLQQGQRERAEELLLTVLDEFPYDPGALNDLGFQWADEGQHLERAVAMLRRAVDAEPDNPAYLDSLGWAQFRLGRTADAVASIEQAIALETADGGLADPEILMHYGETLLAAGRADDAAKAWRDALAALDEDDPRIDLAEQLQTKLSSLAQRRDANRVEPEATQETE